MPPRATRDGVRPQDAPGRGAIEQQDHADADDPDREKAQTQQVEGGHPGQEQLDGDERVGPDEEGQDQQGENADIAGSVFQESSEEEKGLGSRV